MIFDLPSADKIDGFLTNRRAWQQLINVGAAMPHLPFQSQLQLAYQVDQRGANARSFASYPVWDRYKFEIRPNAQPFFVRSKPALSKDYDFDSSSWVKLYEQWQVKGRTAEIPSRLTAQGIVNADHRELNGILRAQAENRGLRVVNTDPEYMGGQGARLMFSRTEGVNRLLLRKGLDEDQQSRAMVGALALESVARISGGQELPQNLKDTNPFVSSAIRHIVLTGVGLTKNRYQGLPKVEWPRLADENFASRWGNIVSLVSNNMLAELAGVGHGLLPSASTSALTKEITRDARVFNIKVTRELNSDAVAVDDSLVTMLGLGTHSAVVDGAGLSAVPELSVQENVHHRDIEL